MVIARATCSGATDGAVSLWRMTGTTVAEPYAGNDLISSYGVPLAWQTAGIGDVNGDGKVDLIWRHAETGDVAVWLMNGSRVTQAPVIAAAVTSVCEILVAGDHHSHVTV